MRGTQNRGLIWEQLWQPLGLVAIYHLGWVLLPDIREAPIPYLLWELTLFTGLAVGYLVFAMNQLASRRFNKACRVWDSILLHSRRWTGQVLIARPQQPASAWQQRLVHRQLAWCYQLRRQLFPDQSQSATENQRVARLLEPAEAARVPRLDNPALQLLMNQAIDVCRASLPAEAWHHDQLSRMMEQFICLQGDCEQLRDNAALLPLGGPTTALTGLFLALLPLGLLAAFPHPGPLVPAVPLILSLLASSFIVVAERRGALSQNPFDNPFRTLPLTPLCEDLERELRQMLDEPAPISGAGRLPNAPREG